MVLDLAVYSVLGLTFSATLIIIDSYLFAKRRIPPGLFLLWFLLGGIAALISIAPELVSYAAAILGTQYEISTVSIGSSMVLLSLILYLFYKLDRLTDKVMKLTAITSSRVVAPRGKEEDGRDG